jgi:hypothetical protein
LFINAELSQIPITDGRKAIRRIVNIAAALREEGTKTAAIVLLDISIGGFRCEAPEPLEDGAEVWLKLPGFEAKRSRVIWVRGNEAGCEFEAPLHPREIEEIVSPAPRKIVKGVFRRV